MNKYEQVPDYILDLHGYTTAEAKVLLDDVLKNNKYSHVRVITGTGITRATGPVMKSFVQNYLDSKNIRNNPAKIGDGGDGALEVFLK